MPVAQGRLTFVDIPLLHDKILGPSGDFREPFDVIIESVMIPQPNDEWFKSRYARAQDRIDELRSLRVSMSRQIAERLSDFYTIDSASFSLPPDMERAWLIRPRMAATLLMGDFFTYIRNALDYLAFALAWSNKGRPQSHTAFPLCVDERAWSGFKGGLRGLTPAQRDVVKQHQPFNGVLWSTYLAHYSNIDKHSSPVEALPQITAKIAPSGRTIVNSRGETIPYVEHIDVDYDFYIGHSTRSRDALRALPILAEIQWGALRLHSELTGDTEYAEVLKARELRRQIDA